MSQEHMPDVPNQPTSKVPGTSVQTQAATPIEQIAPESTAVAAPLSLADDMARIIEEQVDIIVQRQVYHSQMIFGVSGIGTDPVNARNSTLGIAASLRANNPALIKFALVNLGDPQMAQINDQATPFKWNVQVAGMLEGILLDTLARAYKADPARQQEARALLEPIFIEANDEMENQSKSQLSFQAPGPHPNARV